MTDLIVSELFGPTLQGEGPTTGHPAMFVRLGRCNLDCSWCDTPYTWDWTGKNGVAYDPADLVRMTVDDVVDAVEGAADRVVITGGEPLAQRRAVVELVERLQRDGIVVEIETNGTIDPPWELINVSWNVSPKLSGSGIEARRRIKPKALDTFATWARTAETSPSFGGRVAFKFVVACDEDIAEVAMLEDRFGLSNVWIMPEGRTPDAIVEGMRDLAPVAIQHGWRMSSRLHVLVWGDERGH